MNCNCFLFLLLGSLFFFSIFNELNQYPQFLIRCWSHTSFARIVFIFLLLGGLCFLFLFNELNRYPQFLILCRPHTSFGKCPSLRFPYQFFIHSDMCWNKGYLLSDKMMFESGHFAFFINPIVFSFLLPFHDGSPKLSIVSDYLLVMFVPILLSNMFSSCSCRLPKTKETSCLLKIQICDTF